MEINKEKVTGFNKGYAEMARRWKQFRVDIKEALDVKTDIQVSNYRHGKSRMNNPRILAVQGVFEKYGIAEPFDMEE